MAPDERTPARVVMVSLLAIYLATLAPSVTLWDSGEFLSAVRTLGVPHPPGTPLFIFAANAWSRLLFLVPFAAAVNAASAVATAVACACFAQLVTRWTASAMAGVAGGLAAGAMNAVWQSATETEVYAYSLLLVALMLLAADPAGARPSPRHGALLAFLFGLAVPLHLSALVAGPAVVYLAATAQDGRTSWRAALLPAGAWCVAVGLGTVSVAPIALGVALSIAWAALVPGAVPSAPQSFMPSAEPLPRAERLPSAAPWGIRAGLALGTLALTVLGASFVLVMWVRARHDPGVNQGNPSTWNAMVDVVARRQYDVPPLWPRRAPLWLQVGNVVEYADWQVAASLSDAAGPSPPRTPVTIVFVLLAVAGSRWHRQRDRRSWRATGILFLAASLGVVVMLNLRAGPSFGFGVLPDDAIREARERDYFFALAFAVWGVWAGCGAAWLAARLTRATAPRAVEPRAAWPAALALAALPVALNAGATNRRHLPDAALAEQIGRAIAASVPDGSVVVLAGDNDTYPFWFAQHVFGLGRGVAPVTVPLLGAGWYRSELARRHGLIDPAQIEPWQGTAATLAMISARARASSRPLMAAVSLLPSERALLGERWRLEGMVFRLIDSADAPKLGVDSARTSRVAGLVASWPRGSDRAEPRDAAGRYVQRLLRCPQLALAPTTESDGTAARLLESTCNYR